MSNRSILGPADVSDEQLTDMVADLLGVTPSEVNVLTSHVAEVEYDLPAITTAGRWWVRGHADVRGQGAAYAFFVKHVQSWSRHPFFERVPREYRELAAASVPWRTEPLVYRSDLAERLPQGLSMPRALGVFDLDDESATVWLEPIDECRPSWDRARYRRAAHLLGRLAGSDRVRELADVGGPHDTLRVYLAGRLGLQVLPMLRDPATWAHPLVAGAFDDDLRERLLAAADRVADHVAELESMPTGASHGDASPNNLLVRDGEDGFVLIDYGFWSRQPVGFDLAQLVVGDVQIGRRPASGLAEAEEVCLPAYVDGLRAEGMNLPASTVRRAHALQMLVFTGLSTLPFEHLDAEPTPALHAVAAERACIARFSLDLVDATETG